MTGSVSVLNGQTGDLVTTVPLETASPAGLAYDPFDSDVYVADANTASPNTPSLTIINTATNTVAGNVYLPGNLAPTWVVYDPANEEIYTTVSGANEIFALERSGRRCRSTIHPDEPRVIKCQVGGEFILELQLNLESN